MQGTGYLAQCLSVHMMQQRAQTREAWIKSGEGAKESVGLDRRTNRSRLPHSTTRSEYRSAVALSEEWDG